jgi:hypothetical protein
MRLMLMMKRKEKESSKDSAEIRGRVVLIQ